MTETPYSGASRPGIPSSEELRSRIPGWGADLDPADRPSFPREIRSEYADRPAQVDQPELQARERSIEHARLTPVFGTTAPLHGVSGKIRRLAYDRYSEGRAAHWLLLIAADRVESKGAALRSMATLRPDNPITQTGILSEHRRHGLSSRRAPGRVDTNHQWLDPIIVALPWAATAYVGYRLTRRTVKAARSIREK